VSIIGLSPEASLSGLKLNSSEKIIKFAGAAPKPDFLRRDHILGQHRGQEFGELVIASYAHETNTSGPVRYKLEVVGYWAAKVRPWFRDNKRDGPLCILYITVYFIRNKDIVGK